MYVQPITSYHEITTTEPMKKGLVKHEKNCHLFLIIKKLNKKLPSQTVTPGIKCLY